MIQEQLLRFEVMDRAHVQCIQLEATLADHQGLTAETRIALDAAIYFLGQLYQVAAAEFAKVEGE